MLRQIKNIHNLPNLIFLDLYNNCIEHLSPALSCVTTLRVLMLGKNRIQAITHLDYLSKLDVLDLHSNNVSKVGAVLCTPDWQPGQKRPTRVSWCGLCSWRTLRLSRSYAF